MLKMHKNRSEKFPRHKQQKSSREIEKFSQKTIDNEEKMQYYIGALKKERKKCDEARDCCFEQVTLAEQVRQSGGWKIERKEYLKTLWN